MPSLPARSPQAPAVRRRSRAAERQQRRELWFCWLPVGTLGGVNGTPRLPSSHAKVRSVAFPLRLKRLLTQQPFDIRCSHEPSSSDPHAVESPNHNETE